MKKIIAISIALSLVVFCCGSGWADPPTSPSPRVTIVNTGENPVPVTGTVAISPSANTVQLAEGSLYTMTLNVYLSEGNSLGWATDYPVEVPFKTDIWTISCGVPPGQEPEAIVLIQGPSVASYLFSVLTFQQARSGKHYFNATPPWKVTLPTGTLLSLGLLRGDQTTGSASCQLSITGTTTP